MTVRALGAADLKVGHAGQQQTTAARVASAAVNSTPPTFHLARRPVWSSSRHRAAGTAQDGVAYLGGHGVWGAQMCSAGESRRARGFHNARQPARVAVSSH